MSSSPLPHSPTPHTQSAQPCPVAASLWLRRAARRLNGANDSIEFGSPTDINAFLRTGRPVGGFLPAFATPLGERIRSRVSFDNPRSGAELEEAYRRCAREDFDSVLCDLDMNHVTFAEQLEVEVEGQDIWSACGVFTTVAVAMDFGDRDSSCGAQIARIFGAELRSVSSWAVVAGWRMIARKLDAQPESAQDGVATSLMALSEYVFGLLNPALQEKVALIDTAICAGGAKSTWVLPRWREEVVREWREMLLVAKRLRGRIGARTFACITHKHVLMAPNASYRCADPNCEVHHIGLHASEQFERIKILVHRLEGELAILSKT